MKRLKWMALLLCSGSLLFAGCQSKKQVELSVVSEKTYELGDSVILSPENFLLEVPDNESMANVDVVSELKTSPDYSYDEATKTVKTAGKQYLMPGTYQISLTAGEKNWPVTLYVKDTKTPEFISPAAVVTIPIGTEDFDFSKVYRIRDNDETTLRVEGEYDVNTAGTYPVTLIVEDASGNMNSMEISINVISDNQPISSSSQFDHETPLPPVSQTETEDESSEDSSSTQTPSDQPSAPDSSQTACDVPGVGPDAVIYKTFEEAYQAGTAWNEQDPDHYFYYTQGKDSCGNTVYAVYMKTGWLSGSQGTDQPSGQSDTSKTGDSGTNGSAGTTK